ncbi:MAG: universal stress protein [Actinomycetota bacterium]|nr:universal stress protein [Actinomycetota bacterium]
MYERIVAGTDLSSTAKVATDRAASLAKALSARLILVHAGSDPGESLNELGGSYGAEVQVVKGNPVDALIDTTESSPGSLLVVGSVGMSGTRRFMLGNVPNKVSHSATTDLLIVKTDPPPRPVDGYSRIVVGTDGSVTAMSAVDRAADLASSLGAHLLIVCAYDPPSDAELERMAASAGSISAQWDADRSLRDVPDEFRWRIAGAAQAQDVLERSEEHAAKHDVDAEVRTVEGSAPEVLISIAKEEDFELVVVGSVGMTGAQRFKLGNVPHRISHHAPTDLLILRTA